MARSISQQNHLYSQFTHSDPVGCRHPAPTVMPSLPDPRSHSRHQHWDEEEPPGSWGGPPPYWLQWRFLLLPVTKESHLLFAGCEGRTSPMAKAGLGLAQGRGTFPAGAGPPHRASFLDLVAGGVAGLRPIL